MPDEIAMENWDASASMALSTRYIAFFAISNVAYKRNKKKKGRGINERTDKTRLLMKSVFRHSRIDTTFHIKITRFRQRRCVYSPTLFPSPTQRLARQ